MISFLYGIPIIVFSALVSTTLAEKVGGGFEDWECELFLILAVTLDIVFIAHDMGFL